jgi:hypothetical protein
LDEICDSELLRKFSKIICKDGLQFDFRVWIDTIGNKLDDRLNRDYPSCQLNREGCSESPALASSDESQPDLGIILKKSVDTGFL